MKKNYLFSLLMMFALISGQVFGQATCPTTALSAGTVSATSVQLNWAGAGGTTPNATIQRSTDNFATNTAFSPILASLNTYTDATVMAGTTYQYRVVISDATPSSVNCASINVTVPIQAPSGLTVSPVVGSPTSLFLQWTDNSTNENGFDIEQSSDGINFVYRTSVGPNVNMANIAGLAAGTRYYFRVNSYLGALDSPYSNIASNVVSVTPPNPASGAFVNNILQTSATLNWQDNTTGSANELDSEIARASGGGGAYTVLGFAPSNATTYQDNNLLPDNIYQYRILPRNAAGFANLYAFSNAFYTRPHAPSDLKAIFIGLNEVKLQWLDNSRTETGFIVERSQDLAGWSEVGGTSANINELMNTGLPEGTTFYYRVKARNTGGDSPYSNIFSATTLKRVVPIAAYNLRGTVISDTQIDLEWGNSAEDITNTRIAYEIWRSADGGAYFDKIATIEPFHFKYADKTAKPKTKYVYLIHATNFQGKSDPSNRVELTTLGPPFAPSNLAVVPRKDAIGTDVLAVTWKDNSDDEWSFTIERSTDKDFKVGVFIANLLPNTVASTSTPIEEGITYYFRAKAANSYGDSKYSDVVTVTTAVTVAPNAPYALKGTAKADEVSLSWGDDSNKEETFDVERSINGTVFTKIGSTARNITVYADKTVAEKTKYWYRIRAVNSKGNSDFSNVIEITTPAKGVMIGLPSFDDISVSGELRVYPNPTVETVSITLPKSMEKSVGTISVYDKQNREVSRINLKENQEEYKIDLSNFVEGTYTITVRTNTGQLTKRVYKF